MKNECNRYQTKYSKLNESPVASPCKRVEPENGSCRQLTDDMHGQMKYTKLE